MNAAPWGTDGACASLLCDNCIKPGRCCTGFGFGIDWPDAETALEALVFLATVMSGMTACGMTWGRKAVAGKETPVSLDSSVMIGLPFMPFIRKPVGSVWIWDFWCPVLGLDGRCSGYDDRPALCRKFEAGSDPLCAMWVEPPPLGWREKKLLPPRLDAAGNDT